MAVSAPAHPDPRALVSEGAHLIGGDWVPARSGETIGVINPATQEVLLSVPRGGAADVDDAVQAAAAAFPAWRDASPVTRAEALYRWADLCRGPRTRSASWSRWRWAIRAGGRLRCPAR